MNELAITGLGIVTPVGQGRDDVIDALLRGDHAFAKMKRPGRQIEDSDFIGAEIDVLELPESVTARLERSLSWTGKLALCGASEAWHDACLGEMDPQRIGLIVGGTNLQQRELVLTQHAYRGRIQFLRPSYAQSFMDTDIVAVLTEVLGIQGVACSVGAASASGHLAIVQACQAVLSGQVDVCIAVGALMDLSYVECQGLRAVGAMGSDRFANRPADASRPFDTDRDGFVYGESCAAIVIERADATRREPYATLRGWSYRVDGHRNPDPRVESEVRVIMEALERAGLSPSDVDYVNPHGTGSALGDRVELDALKRCGLVKAQINATKSLLGHSLTAAGAVEAVVTLLQMHAGKLHPTRNLEKPLDATFSWVLNEARESRIKNALCTSFGFGGIYSALCIGI